MTLPQNRIHLDYETYSEINLKTSGAWRYAEDPSTDILCAAYAYNDEAPQLWHPGLQDPVGLWERIEEGWDIYAWNANFEMAITKFVSVLLGWPVVRPEQWIDTMADAAALALPLALSKCAIALGEEQEKDTRGRYLIQRLCKPQRGGVRYTPETHPDLFDEMYDYCRQDVRTERGIYKDIPTHLSPYEQRVWQLDSKINRRGVMINRQMALGACAIKAQEEEHQLKRVVTASEGTITTTGQRDRILAFAQELGSPLVNLQAATVAQALTRETLPGPLREILEARKILGQTSVSKFQKMLECASPVDDRIRGTTQYHVATTGRWGGRLIQTHNLPRPKVKGTQQILKVIERGVRADLLLFYDDTFEALASAIRNTLQAREGTEYWISDYSSIEARVLGWLAGEEKYMDAFRRGLDLYKVTASDVFRVPYAEVDDDQRWLGKCCVLALGYNMGIKTFISTIEGYGIEMDDAMRDLLSMALKMYRGTYRKIVRYWDQIEKATKVCVYEKKNVTFGKLKMEVSEDYLFIRLPSGRSLAYPDPKIVMRPPPWGGEPIPNIGFMGQNANQQWVRQTTYGGKLTENVVQAIARDLLAESMLLLDDEGFDTVLHIHDEVVAEVPLESSARRKATFLKCMRNVPTWAKGLPIDSDFTTTPVYIKG